MEIALVLGATGGVGGETARALVAHGWHVRGLTRTPRSGDGIEWVVGDAMDAAASVGDDRLQKAPTGTVRPESFTHGTSADRQKWFKIGFDGGDYTRCNTLD